VRRLLALLFIPVAAALTGCVGPQVAKDSAELRKVARDLYTDQAVENLIRARTNMPFVQLKYSTLYIQVEKTVDASANVDQTVDTGRDLFAAAATRTLTNVYHLGATGRQDRIMNLTADPVTDQNDVYTAYLAFARNTALLVESEVPPCGPVHVYRKWEGKHYWVPVEAAPAFLDLVLKTSLMRGPEAAVINAAYEVKVVAVEKLEQVAGRDIANATLVFDKAVPNGPATMVMDLENGRRVRVNLWPVTKDPDGKRVDLGQPTTRLEIQWAPTKDGFGANNLMNRPVRVYSHDYPPEAPAPNPALHQINANLGQVRSAVLARPR
jgi:hypothetical protein